MPKLKVKKTKNLLDTLGDTPAPKQIEEEEETPEEDDGIYYPHFKKELYLYMRVD